MASYLVISGIFAVLLALITFLATIDDGESPRTCVGASLLVGVAVLLWPLALALGFGYVVIAVLMDDWHWLSHD